MDAFFRGLLFVCAFASFGAGFRTPNFVVEAPTVEFATQVGEAAEAYRKELAIEWTGKPLPGNWKYPCPISVKVDEKLVGPQPLTFKVGKSTAGKWRSRGVLSESWIPFCPMKSITRFSPVIFAVRFPDGLMRERPR